MCRFLTGKKPTKRAALALLRFSAFTLLLVGWGTSGQAQNTIDNVGSAEIQLELNSLAPNENACRVTFVIKNDQPQTLDQLAFEMVLFDTKGGVDRMTKFDFGKLLPQKTIVKRFDLSDTKCTEIGRVLVNKASLCKSASQAVDCNTLLETTNRTGINFGQ